VRKQLLGIADVELAEEGRGGKRSERRVRAPAEKGEEEWGSPSKGLEGAGKRKIRSRLTSMSGKEKGGRGNLAGKKGGDGFSE